MDKFRNNFFCSAKQIKKKKINQELKPIPSTPKFALKVSRSPKSYILRVISSLNIY